MRIEIKHDKKFKINTQNAYNAYTNLIAYQEIWAFGSYDVQTLGVASWNKVSNRDQKEWGAS